MNIALVYTAANPVWVSAQNIRENLKRVWQGIANIHITECPFENNQDWAAWAGVLQKARPDVIVFLESMPVPMKAIGAICQIKSLEKTPLLFHVYGDFSINTHKWFSLDKLLSGRRVRWLAASAAQQGQLTRFLNPKADVRCLPFAVDSQVFNPFGLQRENSKQQYRFFYTGRFSRQKNTLLLLEWAAEYLQKNSTVSFDFAGPFDDIGGELWGLKEPEGWTVAKWMAALKRLPKNVRQRIRHHGILSPAQVRELALESDCYVSLSTYHDEDFGLAPLEALLCGSRAILSGWGGFSSFALDKDSVEILPVGLHKESLTLDKRQFFSALDKAVQRKKVSNDDRFLRHLIFSAHFGIDAVAADLKNLLENPIAPFTGFSSLMEKHSDLVLKHWLYGGLVYDYPGKADAVYRQVYSSYIKPDLKV